MRHSSSSPKIHRTVCGLVLVVLFTFGVDYVLRSNSNTSRWYFVLDHEESKRNVFSAGNEEFIPHTIVAFVEVTDTSTVQINTTSKDEEKRIEIKQLSSGNEINVNETSLSKTVSADQIDTPSVSIETKSASSTVDSLAANRETATASKVLCSKNYWRIEEEVNGLLTCKIGNGTNEVVDETRGKWESLYGHSKHIIHVHGLQHSGTGYLRSAIHKILGGNDNASMQRIGKFEDEGQHVETVYPRDHHRLRAWLKTENRTISEFLYISDICELKDPKVMGEELMRQWSHYWDMSRRYLIQKTPLVDVLFLESVKVARTFHAVVVRHPLLFNPFKTWKELYRSKDFALVWLEVWLHTLELLAEGRVESYAVVTYESLVSFDNIPIELLDIIHESDSKSVKELAEESYNGAGQLRRRLHLHEAKDSRKYLTPDKDIAKRWKSCFKNKQCKGLVQELDLEVFPYFGYTSLGNTEPHAINVKNEFGHVLFSPQNPPPKQLISNMKKLQSKYKRMWSENQRQ